MDLHSALVYVFFFGLEDVGRHLLTLFFQSVLKRGKIKSESPEHVVVVDDFP